MLKPTQLPAYWREALNAVRSICPLAFIGGGALRDLDNDRPVKDIDIFVDASADRDAIVAALASTHPIIATDLDEQYGPLGHGVSGLVEMQALGDEYLPINLIFVTEGTCSPDAQAARFDFGICQIAFDGDRIHVTDLYETDKANQTFTLFAREGDRESRSLKRWGRLSPKYVGWTLVR